MPNKKYNNTIVSVLKKKLCTGCGTCVALCPKNAIQLTINEKKGIYNPELNEAKCSNCGICIKVCPGYGIDFRTMNINIFGKKPDNILIGNYLNCYVGHSNDNDIRYNSASGGLITQILIFALEERMIDGALVTRMKKDKPLEPEPFIARTKEEIIEASKSIYCPVPANVALRMILDANEGERFAVVGLPCHIHGVKKAEQMNKKLRNRIVLHLGLFCNHVPNFWATKLLLHKLKIKEDEVIKLNYRGEGYPGKMKISTKTKITELLLPDYWNFVGAKFFWPTRCLMCSDGICELADISFGDAWLPELSGEKIGKSIIVSKNKFSNQLLQIMNLKDVIKLDEISDEKVILSQAGMLYSKKITTNLYQVMFKTVPRNNYLVKSDIVDYLLAFFFYLNSHASFNSFSRKLLYNAPFKFFYIYSMAFNVLISKKAKRSFRKIK